MNLSNLKMEHAVLPLDCFAWSQNEKGKKKEEEKKEERISQLREASSSQFQLNQEEQMEIETHLFRSIAAQQKEG